MAIDAVKMDRSRVLDAQTTIPGGPRKTRTEMRTQTREALLAFAREKFGAQGFDDMSVEEVAAAAGLTKGAVYHHFGSKQGLFEGVVDQIDREVEAYMQDLVVGLEGWELLRVSCSRYMEKLLDPALQQIILRDAPNHFPDFMLRPKQMRCVALMAETLGSIMPESVTAWADMEALASMMSAAINRLTLWAAAEGTSSALVQAQSLLALLLDGMRHQAVAA